MDAGPSRDIFAVPPLPFSEAEDNDEVFSGRRTQPPQNIPSPPPEYNRRAATFTPPIRRRTPRVVSESPAVLSRRSRSTSPAASSVGSLTSPVRSRAHGKRKKTPSRGSTPKNTSSTSQSISSSLSQSSRSPWILRMVSPSISTVIMVSFSSIAVVALCGMLYIVRGDVLNVVHSTTQMIGQVQVPLELAWNSTSRAVTSAWCFVGGCSSARSAAMIFKTDGFHDLPTTPLLNDDAKNQLESLDISLGHNFFDCLEDLGKIRTQKTDVSHLVTLAPKVHQWKDIIEPADELVNAITDLANVRKEVLMNSNAARVNGRNSIDILHAESERTDLLLQSRIAHDELVKHINSVLISTNNQLEISSSHMRKTAEGIKSAEELNRTIAILIHQEIARLRKLTAGEKADMLKWFAQLLRSGPGGIGDRMKEREAAADFLKDVLRIVDSGAIVSVSSSLSIQQCAINTNHLNKALERTFDLSNAKIDVPKGIRHISRGIGPLKARLNKYDETTTKKISSGT